jgi:D-glycero-alpha-D-manno-heptose-7-phosphate kinase
MHAIKNEALSMKESLLKGDFNFFVESMKLGWENKKKSAKLISNSYIDEIYNEAINTGAQAGKISGAGGGGFMLFFVPTNKRMDLIRKLNEFKGQVSNCHFTDIGVQVWVSK